MTAATYFIDSREPSKIYDRSGYYNKEVTEKEELELLQPIADKFHNEDRKKEEFYKQNGFPIYLDSLPREIIEIEGKKYWKFDYESEEGKKLNLSPIQKILYSVKQN
jgi:hypothetical protein